MSSPPRKNWSSKPSSTNSILVLFVIASLLSACGEQAARPTPAYFIAPTLSGQPTVISLVSPTPPPVTPTPQCTYGLSFLEDVTVPDGTKFAPGASIEKIWRVSNDGTCNWDSRARIRYIDGDQLGAGEEQALFPARAGTEAEIQIIFTAPDQPGTYASRWQAYTPLGEPFGELIFILIEVDPALAPTATPIPEETPTDEP